ncbi:MAG: phosphate:Na+ symporter [Halioglobus sp.]|jgi:phosphate:Na+ symporter
MFEIEIFGVIFVGIGLCYMGVYLLSTHFRQLTNIRFRTALVNKAPRSSMMGLVGAVFGGITYNTTFLSLTLSSLTSSNILNIAKSLPAIIWAVPGSYLMVYLSVISMKFALIFLVGLIGILYSLNPKLKTKRLIEIVFGIGLLVFGISVMKNGTIPLSELDWIQAFIGESETYTFAALLVGAAMAAIVRPSIIVAMFAVVLTQKTLFPLEFTVMFFYGSLLGTAWLRWMQAGNQKGPAKHLSLIESFSILGGGILFITLYFAETLLSIPLIMGFSRLISSTPSVQLANIVLISSIIGAGITSLLSTQLSKYIASVYPIIEPEDITRTHYINATAMEDPESAMDLVEIEQFRLFNYLPQYMEILRSAENFSMQPSIEKVHYSYSNIHVEIQAFLIEFQGHDLAQDTFERFLSLLHRNNVLTAMEKNIYILSNNVTLLSEKTEARLITEKFVEALDTILMMITEAVSTLDSGDLALLYSITNEREDVMGSIRETYLSRESDMTFDDRSRLLEIIVIFEKCIWLARQFCSLLGEGREYRLDSKDKTESKGSDSSSFNQSTQHINN